MEQNLPGRTEWESEQYRRDHGMHALLVRGLREAADYIETHPDLPVPFTVDIHYCVPAATDQDGDDEAHRIAAMLGTTVAGDEISSEARREFGPAVKYRAVYVTRDAMAAHYALHTYRGSVDSAGDVLQARTDLAVAIRPAP